MDNITFTKLPESLSIYNFSPNDTFKFADTLRVEYPKQPSTPINRDPTPAGYRKYADLLEQYEIELQNYKDNLTRVKEHNFKVDQLVKEFIKEHTGFYDIVPLDKQEKVWNLAWQRGHSSGFGEIYYELDDLIDLFR